jgi:surface antigen
MWMGRAVFIAATGALALAACATGGSGVERTGTIPGANPGVVIDSPVGSGVGEVPVGALEGALLGADVGASLEDSDRPIALQAEYEALEYGRPGQPTRWRNRKSGNGGEISVGSSYQVNRLDCREYTHTVSIGGRNRVVRGTACRQPDGVWRVLG